MSFTHFSYIVPLLCFAYMVWHSLKTKGFLNHKGWILISRFQGIDLLEVCRFTGLQVRNLKPRFSLSTKYYTPGNDIAGHKPETCKPVNLHIILSHFADKNHITLAFA